MRCASKVVIVPALRRLVVLPLIALAASFAVECATVPFIADTGDDVLERGSADDAEAVRVRAATRETEQRARNLRATIAGA